MKKNIPELYGSLVFNDKVMKSKLPRDVYKALRKTIENGSHLDLDIANAVAVARNGPLKMVQVTSHTGSSR